MTKKQFREVFGQCVSRNPTIYVSGATHYTDDEWLAMKGVKMSGPYVWCLYCPSPGRQYRDRPATRASLDDARKKFQKWLDEFKRERP